MRIVASIAVVRAGPLPLPASAPAVHASLRCLGTMRETRCVAPRGVGLPVRWGDALDFETAFVDAEAAAEGLLGREAPRIVVEVVESGEGRGRAGRRCRCGGFTLFF
jgi:hypothetical protein